MDVARGQSAREDIDGARGVERARHQDVDEQQLPLRNRMHRDMAIVVQQRGGQATRFALSHRRHASGVHPRRARRGDNQTADKGTIRQLVGRYAEEIGDDVLIVASHASGHRPV